MMKRVLAAQPMSATAKTALTVKSVVERARTQPADNSLATGGAAGFYRSAIDRLGTGETLSSALDLPAESCAMLYTMAYHLLSVGQRARAEKMFYCLCLLDSTVAEHFVGYALCLLARGNYRLAAVQVDRAAQLRPDWAVPHFHLCGIALVERRLPEARVALGRFFAHLDDDTPLQMTQDARRMERFLLRGG
jgi:hypothetical protein